MKYIYIIALIITFLFSMQILAWSNVDIYNNKFRAVEEPSAVTLKQINDSNGEGVIFWSGGGSSDTMDPNDPNWNDPNNGDGSGISILTAPINNGIYIIISLLFIYLLFLAIRNRKTANLLCKTQRRKS